MRTRIRRMRRTWRTRRIGRTRRMLRINRIQRIWRIRRIVQAIFKRFLSFIYSATKGFISSIYIREDTPSRLLTEYKPPENVECLFVEINIRRKKWLLCCSYNPHKSNISNHLQYLNKGLDVYIKHYDNLLILGDLNSDLKMAA